MLMLLSMLLHLGLASLMLVSPRGQMREHVLLSYTLGVKQMFVAVNKKDQKTVNY